MELLCRLLLVNLPRELSDLIAGVAVIVGVKSEREIMVALLGLKFFLLGEYF